MGGEGEGRISNRDGCVGAEGEGESRSTRTHVGQLRQSGGRSTGGERRKVGVGRGAKRAPLALGAHRRDRPTEAAESEARSLGSSVAVTKRRRAPPLSVPSSFVVPLSLPPRSSFLLACS